MREKFLPKPLHGWFAVSWCLKNLHCYTDGKPMTHMTAIVYKYSALSPEILVNFVALHFISNHTCLQLPVVLARLPRNLCTRKVFYVNWKLQSPRSRRRSAVVGQFRLTLHTVVSMNMSQLIPNHWSPHLSSFAGTFPVVRPFAK